MLDLTDGHGAHVVFDGNGERTFRASMRALRRHGTLLYYGAFIGEVPSLSMRDLPNSIKISFPVFRDHIPDRAALLKHSAEIFGLVGSGVLSVAIGGRYRLADAHQAHADLESRTTTGKLILCVAEHE
nr:zinc-binding dehydrogenase [Mycobacterium lepraemurium]